MRPFVSHAAGAIMAKWGKEFQNTETLQICNSREPAPVLIFNRRRDVNDACCWACNKKKARSIPKMLRAYASPISLKNAAIISRLASMNATPLSPSAR